MQRNRNEKLFEAIDAMLASEPDPVTYAKRLAEADALVDQNDSKGLLELFKRLSAPPEVPPVEEPPQPSMEPRGAIREIEPIVQAILRSPKPPKRSHVRFTQEQKKVLQHHFSEEKDYWPSRFMRRKLAKLFEVDADKIYSWFASARAHHPHLRNRAEVPERTLMDSEREKRLLLTYRNWVNRPRFPV